jgi:alkaline phosphatase
MSPAHRTAARLLAKGIAEGKALGKLAIDDMPHMALVATAGTDSIITDSANSASAYATGHKSAVNAMGVYANFLPKGAEGAKRKDNADFVARFRDAGYSLALTGPEMISAAGDPATRRLLGLFTLGNMDGVLDRKFLKGGTVRKFPEQPDLTEQVSAALAVLSRNESGFFLMVESGMIDKYTHLLDMERAVYDTIMLDNAVRLTRDWASARGDDTLILVLADHNHPIGLVGTIEDDMSKEAPVAMRERVRVYERAGFPNYGAADADGYPSRVDVSRRLALFSASLPDHYETFRPKLDNPNDPTVAGKDPATYVANERYKSIPGAVFRFGNLPAMINADVHSGEDVILTATGPGSDRVRGQMDNTEVFRIMVEALGLGDAPRAGSSESGKPSG